LTSAFIRKFLENIVSNFTNIASDWVSLLFNPIYRLSTFGAADTKP